MAEKIAKDFAIQGLNVVIVNPSRVYGPGLLTKSNSTTIMIKNYIHGKWRIIPGNGKRTGNYVFIDDVIEGHIKAMEKGSPGSQYILGGENATYLNFFNTISRISNKKYKLFKIPLWMLIAFAGMQMFFARLAGRSPLLPPKWVKKYMFDWELNHQKAKNELDYKPHSLEKGIQKTIKWLQNTPVI
jgi:farnesol dehydrogenase